ncbi:MAG: SagB/ThcOx family dehydrogenase [Armatimonadota bacterium]
MTYANVCIICITAALMIAALPARTQNTVPEQGPTVVLPSPKTEGTISVEKAIATRRSVRSYAADPVTLAELSQLLWAAQGITDASTGHRAAPSAMAVYPLTIYAVAGNVSGLGAGVYKYTPKGHTITTISLGDKRAELFAAGSRSQVKDAPMFIVIAADSAYASSRFGSKSAHFTDLEAGHVAENIYLQAGSLGLGTVSMAGFDAGRLKTVLAAPDTITPVYLMPVGRAKK